MNTIQKKMWKPSEELLPAFELPASTGKRMGPGMFRQRQNLLLAIFPDAENTEGHRLLEALKASHSICSELGTAIQAVIGGEKEKSEAVFRRFQLPFSLLYDIDKKVVSKYPNSEAPQLPVLLVADRFGVLWSKISMTAKQNATDIVEKALENLRFIMLQCPECDVPDVPPPEV
jgi:peroxiredoxin